LFRSLKNPEKFSVLSISPMLPTEPSVVEQSMTISEGFRLSQFHPAPSSKRDAAVDQGWKISLPLRNELLAFKGFRIERHEGTFPPQVRRRLLIARESSFLRRDVTKQSRLNCGRISKLLRSFEASHCRLAELAPSKGWRTSNESALDVLFPVSSYVCLKGDSLPSAPLRAFEVDSPIDSPFPAPRTTSGGLKRVSKEATNQPMAVDPLVDNENGAIACAMSGPRNPYSVRKSAFEMSSNGIPMTFGSEMRSDSAGNCGIADSTCDETTTRAKSSEILETQKQSIPQENDVFCLPSQDDSMSDDSSKSSGGCRTTQTSMHLGGHKPNDVDCVNGGERTLDCRTMEADAFRLPTPESSSDEEDSTNIDQCSSIPPKIAPESTGSEPANPSVLTQHGSVPTPTRLSAAGSAHSRVRFSLDDSLLRTEEASPLHLPKQASKARKKILAINDTPDSKTLQIGLTDDLGAKSIESQSGLGLSNTQNEDDVNCETLVCAVCHTDRLSKDDPLVLCDGSGPQRRCNLAVHVSCYVPNTIDLSKDEEWRCDACNHVFHGGQLSSLRCSRCCRRQGILKRTSESDWAHFQCQAKPPTMLATKDIARRPLKRLSLNRDRSPASMEAKHSRRRQVMRRFILEEAEASSIDGDGDEEEESDVVAMEEEEQQLAIGFINDSSQLGYTQDGLDESDCDENAESIHRAVDARRDKIRQFSTPVLNRRMQEQQASAEDSPWNDISRSASDSMRGLGNMHFIRSVLEHHRNGGRAEDIEAFYQDLEGSEAMNESECSDDHLASSHSLHP
jgi:hypothetical protein